MWQADVVVDPPLAIALIESQFAALRPVSACALAAGWDNTAYLVNESFIFRFPRREIAVPLIKTEIDILPWLSPLMPLSIPIPTYVGEPSDRYAWPFVGYPIIPGHTLPEARLSHRDRARLAVPLAVFLAALHAVPAGEAREHGAGPDVLDRLNIGFRVRLTDERLSTLVEAGVIRNRRPIDEILEAAPNIESPRSDVLVHGDLHGGQILVGDEAQIVGVIDWGDVHLGDPAVDLAAVHAVLPSDSHDVFLQTYGPVDPNMWSAARARATWHTVALLAHAAATGDVDMVDEARDALDRLVRGPST